MSKYNTENEVWKDVSGYEGRYQISSLGRVKSLKRKYVKEDKVVRGSLTSDGYRQVQFRLDGKSETRLVNSIMNEHFPENEFERKSGKTLKCATCRKDIYRKPSEITKNITGYFFCSSACDGIFRSHKMLEESLKNIMVRIGTKDFKAWLYDKYINEKMSAIRISEIIYGVRRNESSVLIWLRRFNIPVRDNNIVSGKLHWKYNPDKTNEERIVNRRYPEYRQWRKSVFDKDNYTCDACGVYGGKLNAHHLEGYDKNKDLRLDVSNGITLCETCHKKFHDEFGRGKNNSNQYRKFKFNN